MTLSLFLECYSRDDNCPNLKAFAVKFNSLTRHTKSQTSLKFVILKFVILKFKFNSVLHVINNFKVSLWETFLRNCVF